ncbi:MAG: hypothetical protein WC301_01565 [Candidatus Omnitrophota bacterium]|jgi:hypothetical protein
MVKKDIYEHLADIYLNASSKKKKKSKKYPKETRTLFLVSAGIIFILSVFLLASFKRGGGALDSELALIVSPEAVKINFHFDPARKERYSLDLNKLDLKRYSALAFSARRANFKDNVALRIEFINSFKEKSEIYIKNIPHKWKTYNINFSEFKRINDWSSMSSLDFIMEEWNVIEKNGVIYLDDVRFVK